MNGKLLLKTFRNTLAKNSPTILMGLGMAGGVSTLIMAIKATPKALKLIEDEQNRREDECMVSQAVEPDQLTKLDIIRKTWKCYLPAAVMAGLTVVCFVGANSVNSRRRAAIASAYALSESALKELQTKVIETVGEKKAQEIKDSIAQDKVTKNPVKDTGIIMTNTGNTLCYDQMSGRYFRSDIEKIKQTINEMNRYLLDEMWITMNELYDELGLERTGFGSDMGFSVDNGLIDPKFSSTLTSTGEPCLVLDFSIHPKFGYRD